MPSTNVNAANDPSATGAALDALMALAAQHSAGGLHYAGDVSPQAAYAYLENNPGVLVDVRTTAEWQFVGTPDLSATQAKLLLVSWKTYPGFALNMQFAESVSRDAAVTADTPIFFICRSGGRSLDAAVAMTAAGYRHCFNIEGGFEGEPDANGQRGCTAGWKAAQLPWRQG